MMKAKIWLAVEAVADAVVEILGIFRFQEERRMAQEDRMEIIQKHKTQPAPEAAVAVA